MPFLALLTAVAARIGKTVLLGLLTEKVAVRLILWAVSTLASKTTNKWDDATVAFLRDAYVAGGGDPVVAVPLAYPELPKADEPDPAAFVLQQQQLPLDEPEQPVPKE